MDIVNKNNLNSRNRLLFTKQSQVKFYIIERANSTSSDNQQGVKKKPDLRKAASNNRPTQIIAAACILVAIYMYPMIFKPLFGFGSLGEQQSKIMKEDGIDLGKLRPSFMPEWSSPFGPRTKDDDDD